MMIGNWQLDVEKERVSLLWWNGYALYWVLAIQKDGLVRYRGLPESFGKEKLDRQRRIKLGDYDRKQSKKKGVL